MSERRVLVIGGGFAGFVVARHMRHHYKVTLIDAKEYFEYTPGILRAFVHPDHLALSPSCTSRCSSGRWV